MTLTKEYSEEEIASHILYKLARKGKWGGNHTELIHVRAGLSPKYRDRAEDIAKRWLADKDLITWLMKTGQIHISLKSEHRKEILELVEKYHGKQYW